MALRRFHFLNPMIHSQSHTLKGWPGHRLVKIGLATRPSIAKWQFQNSFLFFLGVWVKLVTLCGKSKFPSLWKLPWKTLASSQANRHWALTTQWQDARHLFWVIHQQEESLRFFKVWVMTWNLCRIDLSCPFLVAGVGRSNCHPVLKLINYE